MKRLVILISGRGSNLKALLDRVAQSGWPIQVAAVISNRPAAQGLEIARSHGVPTVVVDHTAFGSRTDFDQALAQAIDAVTPDLIAMAGFMRILSEAFCRRFQGRLLNVHPSLLPSFTGLETHQQALDAGVCVHGCTVHAVTPDLDHGPILAQAVVPVLPGDTAQSLGERVLEMEHQLYPMAVAAVLSGQRTLVDGQWVWATPDPSFQLDFQTCMVHPRLR
jgi:phosphoribosylglycinamide formyltransferase 1